MRRAERAGADLANALLRDWARFGYGTPEVIAAAIDDAPPSKQMRDDDRGWFKKDIGAHNLTGRALEAAYAAYDRGYRARLTEELERLQKENHMIKVTETHFVDNEDGSVTEHTTTREIPESRRPKHCPKCAAERGRTNQKGTS